MVVLRLLWLLVLLCTGNIVLSSVSRPHNRVNPLLLTDRLDKSHQRGRGDVLNTATARERPHRDKRASKRSKNLDLDLDEYMHSVPSTVDTRHAGRIDDIDHGDYEDLYVDGPEDSRDASRKATRKKSGAVSQNKDASENEDSMLEGGVQAKNARFGARKAQKKNDVFDSAGVGEKEENSAETGDFQKEIAWTLETESDEPDEEEKDDTGSDTSTGELDDESQHEEALEKQDIAEIDELEEEYEEFKEQRGEDDDESEDANEIQEFNKKRKQATKPEEKQEKEVLREPDRENEDIIDQIDELEEEEFEMKTDSSEIDGLEDEAAIEKKIQQLQALLAKKRSQTETEAPKRSDIDAVTPVKETTDADIDDADNYDIDAVDLEFEFSVARDELNSTMDTAEETLDEVDHTLEKQGYGIVFVGNVQQLPSIYVSISVMQWQSFDFPIEVFLYGDNNVSDLQKCRQMAHLFSNELDIACEYISYGDELDSPRPTKFTFFASALLRSEFRHVLLLGGNNIVVNDPQILFASRAYQQRGAIFWPSMYGKKCEGMLGEPELSYLNSAWLPDNAIYSVLDAEFIAYNSTDLRYTQSQSASQMVIDTLLHFDLLQNTLQCTQSDRYMHCIQGADCFKFMWMEHGQDNFYFVPIMPEFAGFVSKPVADGEAYVFHKNAVLQYWATNKNVMFIDDTEWKKQRLQQAPWQYFMHVRQPWQCPVFEKATAKFLFPNDDEFVITKVKTRKKVNGDLVELLASKCNDFWQHYESLTTESE